MIAGADAAELDVEVFVGFFEVGDELFGALEGEAVGGGAGGAAKLVNCACAGDVLVFG